MARIVACVINNPGISTDNIRTSLELSASHWERDRVALSDLSMIRYDRKRRGWVPGSKAK